LHFSATQFNLSVRFSSERHMPDDTKLDPFKPPQPQIPGVPLDARDRKKAFRSAQRWSTLPSLWIGVAGVITIVITVAAVWRGFTAPVRQAAPRPVANDVPVVLASAPIERLPVGPGEIATASQLSAPWSSRRFLFRNPQTLEQTPALAVRLPGGALWGISLRDAYGTCELNYVTDLAALRSKYDFSAQHPMVVNPCTDTIYDLAQYESGPNGLVRGEIVKGRGVRPPIAIEVVERGNHIFAVRSE
jgi:hypothetical protein